MNSWGRSNDKRLAGTQMPANHSLLPPAASFGWTVEAASAERLRYAETMKELRHCLSQWAFLLAGCSAAVRGTND